MRRRLSCSVALVLLLAGTIDSLKACGINFSLPEFHFPHVNNQGKLSYWEKLGEIDVGDGLVLPIHLNFSADRHDVSPTLNARGFYLGLTDAHAVQLDERKFRIYTPAGRYRTFYRDRKNPNVLHSGKKWKGELKGDTLSVASECGDRLIYTQGVISEMHLKDRQFTFVKSGRKVTEIREGGKTILKVGTDRVSGDVILSYGFDQKINFQFDERPMVQVIGEQNVVGKKTRSVHRVFGTNGIDRSFEFMVDNDVQPVLKAENHLFAWDPATGSMLSDEEWNYNVKAGATEFDNAQIQRSNTIGENESWNYDNDVGSSVVRYRNGTTVVKNWFTKGTLAKHIRKLEISNSGSFLKTFRFSYDEKGDLLRCVDSDGHTVLSEHGELNENALESFASAFRLAK